MTKLTLAVLTAGAFLLALWLVLTRRALPDPARQAGWRRRFVLATLLFAAVLGAGTACRTCYAMDVSREAAPERLRDVVSVLQAAWLTLDPTQGEAFRKQMESLVEGGAVREKVTRMLALAYAEISAHRQLTRGEGSHATCYMMTAFDGVLRGVREKALRQIELLREARGRGAIGAETAAKAHAALACEIAMLDAAKAVSGRPWPEEDALRRSYGERRVVPTDSVEVAAGLIVGMECGTLPDLTPARRLAAMKKRVEALLAKGPEGHDWLDPGISPNGFAVLHRAGLVPARPSLTCYDRLAVPVAARSEEMKRLQAALLDRSVRAGVLDEETADRAAAAVDREMPVEFAAEEDLRDYQKEVRRAIRLLYKHGELPYAFVRQVEEAADVEVVRPDPSKALRSDARYHFETLLNGRPDGEAWLATLEEHGVIPAGRTRRGVMDWGAASAKGETPQLAAFRRLLGETTPFAIPGDEEVKDPHCWRVPPEERDSRLWLRRALRALVKVEAVGTDRLKPLEDLLGVPVTGAAQPE